MKIDQTSVESIALAPLGKAAVVSVLLILLLVPFLVLISWWSDPAAFGSSDTLFGLAVVGPLIAFILIALLARRSITIEGAELVVRVFFYTRRIALAEIEFAAARAIDLREHRAARPWIRTNGIALPGFAAGHFRDRLKNKLFCLVTAPRVLSLPLRDGRRVLLSAARPAAALERLRHIAGHRH